MSLASRPFTWNDLSNLYRFPGEARQDIEHCHTLHVGDLCWQVFHMLTAYPPSDLIRLWHDGQTLVGFALVYPDFGVFDLQVHPAFRNEILERELYDWACGQLLAINRCSAFYTLVNEHDHRRQRLLEAHHFQPMGDWLYMQRSLASPIATPEAAPGYQLADMMQAAVTARAQTLGRVFSAEPQPERYQTFMAAPGYDPELDIIALTAEGQVAAFALC